jgi:bifunctional non-homologous end joining protein LigD
LSKLPIEKEDPDYWKPMLAQIAEKPFDHENWIYEIKYDGYRTLAVINANEVKLYSRNQMPMSTQFKSIRDELSNIKHSAVLDGEVVIEDETGKSSFQLLQNFRKSGKGELKYYVFDLLNLDNHNTRNLPLLDRKELLKTLLADVQGNIIYSDHIFEKGIEFYAAAGKKNLEGIIAKNSKSQYLPGKRTGEWLKIKINQQEEAVIIGITTPRGSRKFFGALLLGQYQDDELIYIGSCGTGFNDQTLKDLHRKLKPYFTDKASVEKKLKQKNIQWVKPKFVCMVKFTEKTGDGLLRHPVYLGLRDDKKAKEVKAEVPNEVPNEIPNEIPNEEKKELKADASYIKSGKDDSTNKQTSNYSLKIGKVNLKLTNQDKVYFPDSGITKGELVTYYKEISEVMLPYLKNRPQSMNRFPNGINGMSFYQKDVDVSKVPRWLKTTEVYSESGKGNINYLICNDQATLVYMANLGCIEINPWNSTIQKPENPDWLVIDLDPGNIAFQEVVKAALVVKEIIEEMGVTCYCKTSGATGLHVYMPLGAKYDYDTVKLFAELIAFTVNKRIPETTSIERSVKKRKNKIYLDFLQNRRGQTLAAPYSVRPRPGATVSTPLEWKEVNRKLSPSQFTMKNILKRLDKKGDLWTPVIGEGADLNKIMDAATGF